MLLTEDMREMLTRKGYVHLREVPGRGVCGVFRFIYTWGLCWGLDGGGYRGRYCYGGQMEAMVALEQWSGEGDPREGWIKYKGEGGERSPVKEGDICQGPVERSPDQYDGSQLAPYYADEVGMVAPTLERGAGDDYPVVEGYRSEKGLKVAKDTPTGVVPEKPPGYTAVEIGGTPI